MVELAGVKRTFPILVSKKGKKGTSFLSVWGLFNVLDMCVRLYTLHSWFLPMFCSVWTEKLGFIFLFMLTFWLLGINRIHMCYNLRFLLCFADLWLFIGAILLYCYWKSITITNQKKLEKRAGDKSEQTISTSSYVSLSVSEGLPTQTCAWYTYVISFEMGKILSFPVHAKDLSPLFSCILSVWNFMKYIP